MSKVAIAVITWNNADDSIECIESLLAQDYGPLTILSIDNKSTDNSAERMQEYAETRLNADIRCIKHYKNDGTAGGFNVGFEWAIENKYDFVGSLNADAIADGVWVSTLIDEIESHPEVGIVTGLVLRRDAVTVDTSGDFYTMWGLPGPRGRGQRVEEVPDSSGEVFGSSGAGFIARVDAVKDVGFFDKKFFMYYEDVDYAFRMQLRGYRIRYTPHAKAFHKLGASSKTVPGLAVYNTFKNLPMLLWRNVPFPLLLSILPRFILGYSLILGNAVIHGKSKPALRGFVVSIAYLPHALRTRYQIQKNRKVTSGYIRSIILHDLPADQTGLRKFRRFFRGR